MDIKKTFDQLRNLAEKKRDLDVQFARDTFKERLAQIDQLERDLSGVTPSAAKPTRRKRGETKGLVLEAIPSDTSFTIDDLMATINESVSNPPDIASVRAIVRRMHRRGELKQLTNKKNRLVKLYALPDVDCGEAITPVAALIYEVLAESNAAMRPVEICVALIEAGKALKGDPTESVGLVLRTLRDHPDRFKENADGYWRLRATQKPN